MIRFYRTFLVLLRLILCSKEETKDSLSSSYSLRVDAMLSSEPVMRLGAFLGVFALMVIWE